MAIASPLKGTSIENSPQRPAAGAVKINKRNPYSIVSQSLNADLESSLQELNSTCSNRSQVLRNLAIKQKHLLNQKSSEFQPACRKLFQSIDFNSSKKADRYPLVVDRIKLNESLQKYRQEKTQRQFQEFQQTIAQEHVQMQMLRKKQLLQQKYFEENKLKLEEYRKSMFLKEKQEKDRENEEIRKRQH